MRLEQPAPELRERRIGFGLHPLPDRRVIVAQLGRDVTALWPGRSFAGAITPNQNLGDIRGKRFGTDTLRHVKLL